MMGEKIPCPAKQISLLTRDTKGGVFGAVLQRTGKCRCEVAEKDEQDQYGYFGFCVHQNPLFVFCRAGSLSRRCRAPLSLQKTNVFVITAIAPMDFSIPGPLFEARKQRAAAGNMPSPGGEAI